MNQICDLREWEHNRIERLQQGSLIFLISTVTDATGCERMTRESLVASVKHLLSYGLLDQRLWLEDWSIQLP